MTLSDILQHKGGEVFSCSPDDSLTHAVATLVKHKIGSLVVYDQGRMVGILTERDILRACDAGAGSVGEQCVRDRMTPDPITGRLEEDLGEVMGVMTKHRIRHLPVLEGDGLAGLISIGDIVKAQHAALSQENHYLKSYIQS